MLNSYTNSKLLHKFYCRSMEEMKHTISDLSDRVKLLENSQTNPSSKATVRCPTEISVSLSGP